MLLPTSFEILPDEIILYICQYLHGANIFYSFYNLNLRLNTTIAGYCRYINLMSVSYEQFEYSVLHVLPQIGSFVRSFVLNGNWETIIDEKLSSILYGSNFPSLFPQLQRLTIKWFTSEGLLSFVDVLQNFSQLIELDIRCLTGDTIDLCQSKILACNNNQLEIVSFDHDSVDLDISENTSMISYPNIRELTVNLTSNKLIPRLFLLVPNVRYLHVNIDELSGDSESKPAMINLPFLVDLINFKLRSVNQFWTFAEIMEILKSMPSLQQFALDLRTDDERFLNEENLTMILPSSVVKKGFFIRYYHPESKSPDEVSSSFSFSRFPVVYLLDQPRNRFLIHTVPWELRSAILPATISKQMQSGWSYTRQIEDLYVYDITSLLDILLILQHFRRVRILSISMQNKSEILTSPLQSPSIHLKLPWLKQLEVTGICELFPILNAAPNVDFITIQFDSLETLLDNESTCHLLRTQIVRLNITDWVDIQSDLLQRLSQIFTSLHHIVIVMKDPTVLIDEFVLTIISLWKEKSRISIDVKGSLSEEKKENLRQWIVTHSRMRPEESFVIEYKDNWFDLWF